MKYIKQVSENEFLINLFIKPNSKKQEAVNPTAEDEFLVICLRSVPQKNKANIELIKFLKKKVRNQLDQIQIISGHKNQIKKIKLITTEPIEEEQINKLLTS